ncbi:MAG: hypothetical protein K6T34_00695 [Thermoflavifilum sp.]|nr:hypothetical protein [Thermoflavifilum sp.]
MANKQISTQIAHSGAGRWIWINNQAYLFFSGFAYLGLSTDPGYLDLMREGMRKYGNIFPSSRLGNVQPDIYEQAENLLANITHTEDAAVFSSGFLAAQAALQYAYTHGKLLPAPHLHPSWQLPNVEIPSIDESHWQQDCVKQIHSSHNELCFVLCESVDPLRGRIRDFSWLNQIQQPAVIMIDDSHGIGVLGIAGQGIRSLLPHHPLLQYVIVFSMAKAYSIPCGAICGPKDIVYEIRTQPQFTASTPPSPAGLYAFLHYQPEIAQLHDLLMLNIQQCETALSTMSFLHHQAGLPIFYCDQPHLYTFCLQHQLMLSAFPYPHPSDPLFVRIILNAQHTSADIQQLIDVLQAYSLSS